MGVINCMDCGKVILKKYLDLCNTCMESQKKDLIIIKEYLVTHKSANVMEVIENTGLSLTRIREVTREYSAIKLGV